MHAKPRTVNQKRLIESIKANSITFGVGCAGTGKTHLAVAVGLDLLASKMINKIIVTRPAISSEKLGSFPGDPGEKVAPFFIPIMEILGELIGGAAAEGLLKTKRLEITPLGLSRGRTFNNSYVILDEAQNTTYGQLKMFLTRIGKKSTMVLTGDQGQADIKDSGLAEAVERVYNIKGIGVVTMELVDIQRSSLVAAIIEAME